MTDGRTPNFGLVLPEANKKNWTDKMNNNLTLIDALVSTYVRVSNLQGVWTNNFEYEVGHNAVDDTSGVVYTALVEHVSASAPTTFLQERTNHPTYWQTFALAARNRGAWSSNTAYSVNDFVLADGLKYAMCIGAHTSGASFATDLAAGKWEVMIDLSTVGSLVLPVLSGVADANKIVMTDTGGNAYIINSAAALSAILVAAGVLAPTASPQFTGTANFADNPPVGLSAAIEDFSTKLATTLYADRAVRSIVLRQQQFVASGTYTPNPKMLYCIAECVGGGGAGGAGFSGVAGATSGGGGGGAGAYARKVLSAADIGVSKDVTIGAAGAGGAGTGGTGGDTFLGASMGAALVGAKGGTGGTASDSGAGAGGVGGAGGSAASSVGDFVVSGGTGFYGLGATIITIGAIAGSGASSYFGGGAPGSNAPNTVGTSAIAYGSGGAGGQNYNSANTRNGGNGAGGAMMITEICYG